MNDERTASDPADAAGWRVALDASPDDAALPARFSAWLDASPAHEREMERVELAIELARQLAADPDIAAAPATRQPIRRRAIYGMAAAVTVAVATTVSIASLNGYFGRVAIVRPELRAAALAGLPAPATSVVVLPTGVVVDSGSVALLPFAADANSSALAAGLEADVAAALRGVPGIYVRSGSATAPYTDAPDLSAPEIASQLGARGLVTAAVRRSGARVHVSAGLRDARTDTIVWAADLEEPVDRLAHLRDAIADGIALSLVDATSQADHGPRGDDPTFAVNTVDRSPLP